jgi:hypothetical protein
MKIYLFNPETGIYLGEDFADEAAMKKEGYILPPDATTIAPPQVERGQIPVFNLDKEHWEVKIAHERLMPRQIVDSWPMRVKGIKSKPGTRLSLNHSEYVISL